MTSPVLPKERCGLCNAVGVEIPWYNPKSTSIHRECDENIRDANDFINEQINLFYKSFDERYKMRMKVRAHIILLCKDKTVMDYTNRDPATIMELFKMAYQNASLQAKY